MNEKWRLKIQMHISRVHGINKPNIRKILRPDGSEVKTILPDGRAVSPIDWPTEWFGERWDVSIRGVAEIYRDIQPYECLVLGGGPRRYNAGTKRTQFTLPPTNLMVLDVDGMPYADGHSDATLRADPEGTIRAQLEQMFGTVRAAQLHFVVVLSSRAGFTGDFRAHVWVGLAEEYAPKDIAALQRGLGVDWIDAGIFQAGRVLFAAPPEIDHDPFPIRVFDLVGQGLSLDLSAKIKSTDGLVPLTKPVIRGKHGLYRLNEDRLRASEFVSEECFNFVLSAKRAGMTEDDMITALHAEFERIDVPPATWARMRSIGTTLGDARRMYRSMREGETTVYGEPAYREPDTTLDAASEALRAAVASQLGREGVFLNKVTLGVGKTHEIVEAVTSRDVKALILAPNHERCAEIVERLEAARERRLWQALEEIGQFDEIEDNWLERPWASWRGRSADGMCARLPAVDAAFKAGVSVHKHICGFPSGDDMGDEKRCPLFASFAYADQVMNFWRYNWVAPVAMLPHLSRIASDADVVIIDEGCVDLLGHANLVPLEDLIAPRDGRLGELSRRAYLDLMEDKRSLTFDELQEALALEQEARPSPLVEPDMTDDEIISNCDLGKYRKGCVSIWKALIAEQAGGENHLHVFHKEEKDDKGETIARWWVQTAWRAKARLLEKVNTVLLFDATPNVVALKAHWPELEVFEVDAPKINTRVVQVTDAMGNRKQLINDLPKTDPKWAKEEERVKKARARIASWLKAQPGYTVVVTKKEHREAIEKEHRFERVAFAHHGAVEGKDVWDFPDGARLHGVEVDNLVVLGRNAPQPYIVEAMARSHHCDEAAIKRMGWYRVEHWELANGVAGYRLRHDDPRADAIIKHIAVDGQMQAIGRMRSVRRQKMGRVFILHCMRLDVEVTECVTASEVMRRVGDVTLLSPKEVDRVFGDGGRATERVQVEATHKYWREAGQTQPYRCRVADGADVDAAMEMLGAVRWEKVE